MLHCSKEGKIEIIWKKPENVFLKRETPFCSSSWHVGFYVTASDWNLSSEIKSPLYFWNHQLPNRCWFNLCEKVKRKNIFVNLCEKIIRKKLLQEGPCKLLFFFFLLTPMDDLYHLDWLKTHNIISLLFLNIYFYNV